MGESYIWDGGDPDETLYYVVRKGTSMRVVDQAGEPLKVDREGVPHAIKQFESVVWLDEYAPLVGITVEDFHRKFDGGNHDLEDVLEVES